jgi:hypothetical protein
MLIPKTRAIGKLHIEFCRRRLKCADFACPHGEDGARKADIECTEVWWHGDFDPLRAGLEDGREIARHRYVCSGCLHIFVPLGDRYTLLAGLDNYVSDVVPVIGTVNLRNGDVPIVNVSAYTNKGHRVRNEVGARFHFSLYACQRQFVTPMCQ